jgi:hypothetical protein
VLVQYREHLLYLQKLCLVQQAVLLQLLLYCLYQQHLLYRQ